MQGLFLTKLSAYKHGLLLRRERVEQALHDYRSGIKEAEWSYRNCGNNLKIHVDKEKVQG